MIKKTKHTKLIDEYFCDICCKKADKKCEICGKDLCRLHTKTIAIENFEWDRCFSFCNECYNPFKNNIESMHEAIVQKDIINTTINDIIADFFIIMRKSKGLD